MKARSGFVSNSSSSCFIVSSWRNKESTIEDAEKLMSDLVNLYAKWFDDEFTKDDYTIEIMEKSYEDYLVNDWEFGHAKDCASKLMIQSTDDNSIPYCLFDIIEDALGLTRLHLG